jgi:nucleotide-binding universal stress UspA family protein
MAQPDPYKFLLPTDGSIHAERAAHYLAHYAKTFRGTQTIVLYVREAESIPTHAPDGTELGFDLHTAGMAASQTARQILDAENVPFRLDTELGEAADVIAQTAEIENVNEVVMGSRGMNQWQGVVVGSVAYKVIHRVSVPITIVGTPTQGEPLPAATTEGLHRVLLAVDGSSHAVRAARYICKLHSCGVPMEVELLNVPPPIPQGYIRSFLTPNIIDDYYRDESLAALREASDALRSAQVKFNTHVMPGPAAQNILLAARKQRCSRIVMGTRGLGAISGLVLGSIAYQVIHLSPVPVTLVK